MHRKITVKALTLVFFLFSIASFAKEEKAHLTQKTKEQREKEVEEYIPHHLLDSYDLAYFLTQMMPENMCMLAFLFQ